MGSDDTFMFGMSTTANQRGLVAHDQAQPNDLYTTVQNLSHALAVEKATTAGLQAQVAALSQQHPDAPLLQPCLKFEDGTPKSALRIVFESAFDKALEEKDIANPRQYRKD